MNKKELKKLSLKIVFGILFMFVGVALAAVALIVPFFVGSKILQYIALGAAALTFLAAGLGTAVNGAKLRRHEKEEKLLLAETIDVKAEIDGSAVHNGEAVNYIPDGNLYELVNMGKRQSTEEKFSQIARMDKTQFVIYIARLFSRKGYQVKLTPVIDNRSIDMIVEKAGTKIAVGCLLTDKILSEADVRPVCEGRKYYAAAESLALTNTFFDRSAVDFAKKEKMSLIDRNILAEDFM